MSLAQSILPEFDHEAGNTLKMLERCPDDQYGWRPHDKSWTLGELVSHLCNLPMWTVSTINQDTLDMAPVDGEAPQAEEIKSTAAAIEAFKKNTSLARDAIAGASDETLFADWTLLSGGHEVMKMPRIAVLRGFCFNHQIHHRGQLSIYLRLLNVPLPSVYGPTADEQPDM